jgi:hypothetical protein
MDVFEFLTAGRKKPNHIRIKLDGLEESALRVFVI